MQVQCWLQASNNTGILNTCTQLWLTESEQATPMDSIKDIVRSSVFNKHLKKAGDVSRNVVEITIKMKSIVRKPFMIKIFLKCFNNVFIILQTARDKNNAKVVGSGRVLWCNSVEVMPRTILPRRNRRRAPSATSTRKPEQEKDARGVTCFNGGECDKPTCSGEIWWS